MAPCAISLRFAIALTVISGGMTAAMALPTLDLPSRAFTAITPDDVVPVDFDVDGDQDLLVIMKQQRRFQSWRNLGLGHFSPGNMYPGLGGLSGDPVDAEIADLNEDDLPDVLICSAAGRLDVFENTGTGTFSSPQMWNPFISGTASILAGVFEEDDHVDVVAVGGRFENAPLVRFGRGDGAGGFILPFLDVPVTDSSVWVRQALAGDWNGDGHLDIILGGQTTSAWAMFGDGTGNFSQPSVIATGPALASLALADFNGDQRVDLAMKNFGLSITFGQGTPVASSIEAVSADPMVAVGDVDHDADIDYVGRQTVGAKLYRNDGSGNLDVGTPYSIGSGSEVSSVNLLDASGRGEIDIVLTQPGSSRIAVLYNRGGGDFAHGGVSWAMEHASASEDLSEPILTDLNGDARLDLVAANPQSSRLSIRLGTGGGALGPRNSIIVGGEPRGIDVGDLNGDDQPDVVAASPGDGRIRIALGDGSGQLAFSSHQVTGERPVEVKLANFDADEHLDLAVADPGFPGATEFFLLLRSGNGDGTFGPVTSIAATVPLSQIRIADLNEDEKPDLVAASEVAGRVLVYLGVGDGTFGTALEIDTTSGLSRVRLVDVNGDGHIDITTCHSTGAAARLYAGDGTGGFTPAEFMTSQTGGLDLDVADLDVDGDPEVIVTLSGEQAITLVDDSPTFESPWFFPAGVPSFVRLARMDEDPLPDLVVTDLHAGVVWIYPNVTGALPVDVLGDSPARGSLLFAPLVRHDGKVSFRYRLAVAEPATLGVFDVRGRRLWETAVPRGTGGEHVTLWDPGRTVARGIYFVRLHTPSATATRKVPLVIR